MSLDEVITHNITRATSIPSQQGFGTALLMIVDTVTPNVLMKYTSVKGLKDAGYPESHPVIKMATSLYSQNPRPTSFMVGKRSNAHTQTVEVYPLITTEGYRYQFSVVDPDGTTRDINYPVEAAATTTTIAAALAPLMVGSSTLITCTASTTKVIVEVVTPGKLFDLKNLPNPADLKIKDITTDPGIAADLSAIEALDNKTWYAVALDWGGKATVTAAAAWIEARKKLFGYDTSDSEVVDNAVTNDVMSTLKASSYARTFGELSQRQLLAYQATAVFGARLPTIPGKANWSYITLTGVPFSLLTDGQKAVAINKNGNTYTEELYHQFGIVAANEYIDIIHGSDWLYFRMQERLFGIIKNASDAGRKIPYTNAGRDVLLGGARSVLSAGVSNDFLAADPAPVVTGKDIEDIDPADQAARHYPAIEYSAKPAGAINKITINGTLAY